MSDAVVIKTSRGNEIRIWTTEAVGMSDCVGVEIFNQLGGKLTWLTASQVDALIRALAAARVELSKARP